MLGDMIEMLADDPAFVTLTLFVVCVWPPASLVVKSILLILHGPPPPPLTEVVSASNSLNDCAAYSNECEW